MTHFNYGTMKNRAADKTLLKWTIKSPWTNTERTCPTNTRAINETKAKCFYVVFHLMEVNEEENYLMRTSSALTVWTSITTYTDSLVHLEQDPPSCSIGIQVRVKVLDIRLPRLVIAIEKCLFYTYTLYMSIETKCVTRDYLSPCTVDVAWIANGAVFRIIMSACPDLMFRTAGGQDKWSRL